MLDITNVCSIKTNAPNDGSKLGINVNGLVDWSTQWAVIFKIKFNLNIFLNLLKNI